MDAEEGIGEIEQIRRITSFAGFDGMGQWYKTAYDITSEKKDVYGSG